MPGRSAQTINAQPAVLRESHETAVRRVVLGLQSSVLRECATSLGRGWRAAISERSQPSQRQPRALQKTPDLPDLARVGSGNEQIDLVLHAAEST